MKLWIAFFVTTLVMCDAQFRFRNNVIRPSPLPFPPCKADSVECLRRGVRSFFFMMDAGMFGMRPVDPLLVNSVAVSLPQEGLRFRIRNANVTGARWTRLANRKFNLAGGKSGVVFKSDLHITGEITMEAASRIDPYFAFITLDVQDVESNITYAWTGERRIDNEDYIIIGNPRIAVRNMRIPTFFLQPLMDKESAIMLDQALQLQPSVLELLAIEIETAVMQAIVDNFRLFASRIPVKYFYEYY